MFANITDYFIPADFAGSLDLRRQVRIILNTVLLTSLFSLNFMVLCWWANLLPGFYVLLFGVVSFVLLPFGYRAGWYSHVVLGYAFLFVGYLTVVVNSAYQGGYYAPTTWWLGLCSVMGFFLLGRRAGLISFGVALATVLVFWGLEQRHYGFPNLVPADKAQFWHLDILAGLMLILLVVALVFDNINAHSLRVVGARNALLSERTAQLEQSLADLQAAQAQLVQREKMAFLGELTAGIAHELQNPLNFMKNFAEVSTDLVDDIGGGTRPGGTPRPGGLESEILAGLKQNLREISQHGQRATAIIKGMLEHSRTGTGQRVPTPLNALVEDSLRLSYQGLRAKDRDFSAELTTALDPALPLVAVVPQDLRRVLINLCTNGLHALRERARTEPAAAFAPELALSTHLVPGAIEIRVRDNGTGMPDHVRQNVFQPFFTTKPVGEGTGLGLSMSFDIITKGHGGTLAVSSTEGIGTEFVIRLPQA